MAETLIPVPEKFAKSARIGDMQKYRALYDRSLSDPDRFWAEQAERLHWFKKWDKVSRWDFKTAKIERIMGGKLKGTHNGLDQHVTGRRKETVLTDAEGAR